MEDPRSSEKVALVYDDLFQKGGGEKFFLYLCSIFSNASIVVPIINDEYLLALKGRCFYYSKFLSRLASIPGFYPISSLLSLFYFQRYNFSNTKLVVSVSNRFSQFIVTSTDIFHLCIVTTPFRYVFESNKNYFLANFLVYLRCLVQTSFKRADRIISISSVTQKRLRKIGVESSVINPPLIVSQKIEEFTLPHIDFKNEPFFLVVGRCSKSKVKYFEEALDILKNIDTKVVFVGKGERLGFLKRKYKKNKNIIFTNYLKDEHLNYLYSHAIALIHPQIEDYGLIPLEALYFKCPVICKNYGGVLDYLNSKVAIFYNSNEELLSAINKIKSRGYVFNTVESGKVIDIASKKNFEYNLLNQFINL